MNLNLFAVYYSVYMVSRTHKSADWISIQMKDIVQNSGYVVVFFMMKIVVKSRNGISLYDDSNESYWVEV